MSRLLTWRRFVELRFEDDAGQPVEAFELNPLPETVRQLSRNRLVFRRRPDGMAIFFRLNLESNPPLLGEITSRIRLAFSMRLTDGKFYARHLPDLTAITGAGLHLDNLDNAGAILADGAVLSQGAMVAAADAVGIGPTVFPVQLDLTAPTPTAVEARDPVSNALTESEQVFAQPGAAQATVSLNLSEASGSLFRAVQVPAGALDRRIYANSSAAAGGASGIVEVYWETAQTAVPDPAGLVYRAVFERR